MSNYSQTTFFAPKDSLSTNDPDKKIFGAEVDPELAAISTAIATKVDTAGTGLERSGTTLNLSFADLTAATPVSGDQFAFADASDANAEKKVTLANLNAALLLSLMGDYEAGADIDHAGVSILAGSGLTGGGTIEANRTLNIGEGTGITVSADAISTNDSEIVHDSLSGFVADEHINHGSVSITAGNGLTGGGTIAATRSLVLGTPGALTATSTDAVTASSHTHSAGAGIVKTDPGTGGQITVSGSAASGSATNGDIWLQI